MKLMKFYRTRSTDHSILHQNSKKWLLRVCTVYHQSSVQSRHNAEKEIRTQELESDKKASSVPQQTKHKNCKIMQRTLLTPSSSPIDLPTTTTSLAVEAQWNLVRPVDLDISCVVYGKMGDILDCAYYNQKEIEGVVHHGDSKTDLEGVDESLSVDLKLMNPAVKALVFTVCCYRGGDFTQVRGFNINFVDYASQHVLSVENPDCQLQGSGCVAAILYRPDDLNLYQWRLVSVHTQVLEAKNFMECHGTVQKLLCDFCGLDSVLIAEYANGAPAKPLPIAKGEFCNLPSLRKIRVGLAWEAGCDVDSSVVVLDKSHEVIGIVYFRDKIYQSSIVHNGDNLSGDAEGDDETIDIDLGKLSSNVHSLVVVINVFSSVKTFADVNNASVRLMDGETQKEICSYKLNASEVDPDASAYVLARIYRHKGPDENSIWRIRALGMSSTGRMVTHTINHLIEKTIPVVVPQYSLSLQISNVQGRNLAAKDFGGSSDPYFVVYVDDEKLKPSNVLPKTLNPVWSDICLSKKVSLSKENAPVKLRIEVWDEDKITADDFMGQVELEIRWKDETITDTWFEVQKRNSKDKVKGEITFTVTATRTQGTITTMQSLFGSF